MQMFTVHDEAVGPHLHLLLPAGEEFFVDVFKKALPLIKDDQLRLDVQGYSGRSTTWRSRPPPARPIESRGSDDHHFG